MAIVRVPKEVSEPSSFLGDHAEFGPALFSKLVPFAVHLAASIYEERRDRLVNTSIVQELEVLTTKIHDTLQSLNLPGALQALEKPLGLPPTLLSHAEEIRQADALGRIQRSFNDTAKLKASDEAIYVEGREILQAEAVEDDRLRSKYGTDRWTRPASQVAADKLYAQVTEIDGYLKSAANSDELVRSKFHDCEDMLRMLSSSDRELGSFVPSSRRVTIPANVEGEASRLRSCLNDISRLESRRRRTIETVREKARKDDINSAILAEAARLEREFPSQQIVPAHFEDFFEARLARYDADLEALQAETAEQEQLLERLDAANQAFNRARRGDTSSRDREQALQRLENAYFKYKEIVSNLEVGRKFYNDLSRIVGRFRDDCKAFASGRRQEAAVLESYVFLSPPFTTPFCCCFRFLSLISSTSSCPHTLHTQKEMATDPSQRPQPPPSLKPVPATTKARSAAQSVSAR
jgi:programmed cell death 6-interacting protein